ncbi:NAD(P)/FAD-dependent oxidoreductase [Arenibaculum pallidiluteum]|uniref:NAD(P)/FAD-dependent oxidoreductase n=1 Tax=Arenibaculum pallidiluteum TaxID=2812559 RepID=UPI001A9601B2|nr:FAD-dependent oxidoreductase [Arenibaculum pallidiluteum]
MGKRVVLLGAGHAHLHAIAAAGDFAARGHELVVVAPDRFWYSGLATGMLGGEYPPALDQVDVSVLAARGGARFVAGRLHHLDRERRVVHLAGGTGIPYDTLSVNLGSEPPAIPGEEDCPTAFRVKPVRRVAELRAALEGRFAADPARPIAVLVAGGGVTACELAANLLGLAARRSARVAVSVLASGGGFLRQLPPGAAASVRAVLERRGAVLRAGARVIAVEGEGNGGSWQAVLEGGERLAFDLFLNASGLRPNPAVRALDLPVDDQGALLVDRHLRSVADARVHGGGDCVAVEGHALPRIGVYAIREAPVLRRNLLAALGGGEPEAFRPQRDYLWIMNLGDGTGLAARGRLWWHGRAAHWLKDRIDRRFLGGYQRLAGQAEA